ncbi:hypothetical protein [Thermanaeromonas sp. C210]|uniref:hypothetical protein n=1 Tax=Thermanaeromonas sp. C210 TaxID=2731925 RepID=UPI00155B5802|nr:hypothetical protein [Thermanaeromonas sp. C210]GFN23733.1 hypothetical protein TAMC210_20500 [Thermanaeromonas sp. C210]
MTFYYDRLKHRAVPPLPPETPGRRAADINRQQQVSVTLVITNMTTKDDCTKLVDMLGTLPGVSRAIPLLSQRRLIVTYNPWQITLETICFHIRQLGYHYVQKI